MHFPSGNPSDAVLSSVPAQGGRQSLFRDFSSEWELKAKGGKELSPSCHPLTNSLDVSEIN